MKVAIICEHSGTVRDAFTKAGHLAISFDMLPTESPGWHVEGDVMRFDNDFWKTFDLAICHPPCTYLTFAGNKYKDLPGRAELRAEAMEFFMWCVNLPIDKICVENPVGFPNSLYRKPDQVVHPWYFGEPYQKRTCFWLKGLNQLRHDKEKYEKPEPLKIRENGKRVNWVEGITGTSKENPRWKMRSKTFQSIADAMAEQWG